MTMGMGLQLDSSGNAYVTGYTVSTDFPTATPFQPSSGGNYDAFVTKLNASGSALVYSTYLGGVVMTMRVALLWTLPATPM